MAGSIADVLSAAADLLEKPGAWTQHALCRDESGKELSRGYGAQGEAKVARLEAALAAAIAAEDGLSRATEAEAQLDRIVDYLAGHLNGLRVGRKEAVDTVIVNLTKLIEAQKTGLAALSTPNAPGAPEDGGA